MSQVEKWERRAEVPLLLLAVALLVAYAWPILDPRLDGSLQNTLNVLGWAVWAAFALDFAARIWLAEERRRYVLHHWYDAALRFAHAAPAPPASRSGVRSDAQQDRRARPCRPGADVRRRYRGCRLRTRSSRCP